jgi:S1-C subfamily serine protease
VRKNRLFYVLAVALVGIVGLGLLFPGSPVTAQNSTASTAATGPVLENEKNTVQVAEQRGPSVVAVNVEFRGSRLDPLAEMFPNLPQQFFNRVPQVQQGSGSGFVIDHDELVTNFHVVQGALQPGGVDLKEGASIRVVFPGSDEEFGVRVVGANPDYDLALLELTGDNSIPATATPMELADSSTAQVGQKVIAIGNPFGLQSSVSQGIISAIGRELPSIGRVQIPMIQTDAAINPGNSGGPLLDSSGRLIGINTMIVPGVTANGSAGNIGIGFAVPSVLLIESLPAMRQGGLVGTFAVSLDIANRPRLGVEVQAASDYPARVREILGMPDHGLVVASVQAGGPAEQAGLLASSYQANVDGINYPAGGDIILSANGVDIKQASDLYGVLEGSSEGDQLRLQVWRRGETRDVTVTLQVVPLPDSQNQN